MELDDVKKPTLYSAKETAKFMNIGYYTFYRLVRSGKIKAVNVAKTGKRAIYAFRPEDIQDYYDNLPGPVDRPKDVNKQNLCGDTLEQEEELQG
jgi:excisionase family DNA binding protein